jgi:hypothetical protein
MVLLLSLVSWGFLPVSTAFALGTTDPLSAPYRDLELGCVGGLPRSRLWWDILSMFLDFLVEFWRD